MNLFKRKTVITGSALSMEPRVIHLTTNTLKMLEHTVTPSRNLETLIMMRQLSTTKFLGTFHTSRCLMSLLPMKTFLMM